MNPTVTFVGAGPGDPELLTLRGAREIAAADVVVWAASLVNEAVLEHARPDAEIHDSSTMTLEDVVAVYVEAAAGGRRVTRLQSGDLFLYSAINEQIAELERRGIGYSVIPGVSSVGAAAALIGRELTVPGVTQSVVLTRIAGRTGMPERETLGAWAQHRSTMAIFLSAARPHELAGELLAQYPGDTPVVIVHRASWPDEAVLHCRLDGLAETLFASGWRLQVLVLVGPGLEAAGDAGSAYRSNLYDPSYAHRYRKRRA